jgi:hemolysin III
LLKPNIKQYTIGEEIANSITHGIGAVLSIAGLVLLIIFAAVNGNAWHIVSFSIFGSTLIFLYLASTLYHSLPNPTVKMIFKRIDHSAIYLLIAGTYTPFTLIHMRGVWGWTIFGIIWTLAIAGIILKIFTISRFKKLSLTLYIAMGWLCVIAFHEMITKIPTFSLTLLIIGGLIYTTGVVFYIWKKLPYGHAIWHLFVLGGSTLHFFAVLNSI